MGLRSWSSFNCAGRILRSLHTPQYKRYIVVLTQARGRAGLTQQELAHRLGKPQSFVSKYERGERRLDVPEFVAIAKAMCTSARALLARVEAAL
jgi:transcriptional regulator with XRE-family HTH domain